MAVWSETILGERTSGEGVKGYEIACRPGEMGGRVVGVSEKEIVKCKMNKKDADAQ